MTAYLPRAADESSAMRLFCFHHAGGGATTFNEWQRHLGPRITVLPVQLPGRESRAGEQRFTDMTRLVADLDQNLDRFLDRPYAFYGHSMGGIVAYNLAAYRAARGESVPYRLMVGAYPPPHLLAPITDALNLPDDQLAQWLVKIGGMSELILKYPNWVKAALDMLRDDLRVCQSHRSPGQTRLPCPIEVFAGDNDPLLSLEVVDGWKRHSSAGARVHVIPGGHFFTQESASTFFRVLSGALHSLQLPV
jgi:surfactin synthase thioesterase subunit